MEFLTQTISQNVEKYIQSQMQSRFQFDDTFLDLNTCYKPAELHQIAKLPLQLQHNNLFAIQNLVTELLQAIYPDIQLYSAFQNFNNMQLLSQLYICRPNASYSQESEAQMILNNILNKSINYNVFIFYTNYNFEIQIMLSSITHSTFGCCKINFEQYNKHHINEYIEVNLQNRKISLYSQNEITNLPQQQYICDIRVTEFTFKLYIQDAENKHITSAFIARLLSGCEKFTHPKVYLDFLHFNNDNKQIMMYCYTFNSSDKKMLTDKIDILTKQNVELYKSNVLHAENEMEITSNCTAKISNLKQMMTEFANRYETQIKVLEHASLADNMNKDIELVKKDIIITKLTTQLNEIANGY